MSKMNRYDLTGEYGIGYTQNEDGEVQVYVDEE